MEVGRTQESQLQVRNGFNDNNSGYTTNSNKVDWTNTRGKLRTKNTWEVIKEN